MEIQEIRKRIDEADEQLVQAFAKRMRAASSSRQRSTRMATSDERA